MRLVKKVMGEWEERNLDFGTERGEDIRVLGSWVGEEADVRNRIRRADNLWAKVKGWLKGSRLSRRWQGKIVEACVENNLLYHCQAAKSHPNSHTVVGSTATCMHTVTKSYNFTGLGPRAKLDERNHTCTNASYMRDFTRHRKSDVGKPLRQMAERHENMIDIRGKMEGKSFEWKIEKRV